MNKHRTWKNNSHTFPYIFVGLTLFVAIIIYIINPNFTLPDVFLNRNLLNDIYILVPKTHTLIKIFTESFKNPNYTLYNSLFQIFSLLVSFIVFSFIFKIKNLSDFFNLITIKNKLFIYIWINLVTLFIIYNNLTTLFSYYHQYYLKSFDLLGRFTGWTEIGITFLGIILYIPIVNLIFYLTYNKLIKNKIVKSVISFILYIFLIILLIETAVINCYYFSWMYIIYYLYTMITVYIIVSALRIINLGTKECNYSLE